MHQYAENEHAMKINEAILNDLPGELYTTEANHKTPDNWKYPLATIQTAQNQKVNKHRRLSKLLKMLMLK